MTEIRYMTEIAYNMHELLAAKESFEQANPGIRIIVEQAKDYFEIMQAFQSDDAPDIIETGGFPVGNPNGMFVDLNPYVAEAPGLEEDLFAGLMRIARHGGTLPGLPIEISPPLFASIKSLESRMSLV